MMCDIWVRENTVILSNVHVLVPVPGMGKNMIHSLKAGAIMLIKSHCVLDDVNISWHTQIVKFGYIKPKFHD